MQDIARELHISSRTLQRHLQDAGYSFQQVLEEARHQLARHYLNNSLLELNETAYLLGYEDSNSFVRAFRTWEGVPPASWRGAQRARAAS
jgi:AraC-like DNA-binding protein